MSHSFNVVRAADVKDPSDGQPRWLVEPLWGVGGVGVIGGAPKSCKSWLALEMAVAVASGRPCLGRFAVGSPGTALVFAAEDAPVDVRDRIEHLAQARGTSMATLDVRLIVEPSVRLDRPADRARLRATLGDHGPKLLVLDPYVRLQCGVDENDASQVAAILGTLREISREFRVAVALVHHARKGGAEDVGEGLRGSGDFYAWADSLLYVRRRKEGITLTVSHRAAASPAPLTLQLVDNAGPVRLEVQSVAAPSEAAGLPERILVLLQERPRRKEELRLLLRVRNQHLAEILRELEQAGRIVRTAEGWRAA